MLVLWIRVDSCFFIHAFDVAHLVKFEVSENLSGGDHRSPVRVDSSSFFLFLKMGSLVLARSVVYSIGLTSI